LGKVEVDEMKKSGRYWASFKKMDKAVNTPPHYLTGGIETIDFIRAKLTPEEFRGFCKGNVIKYLSRAEHKGGDEDYKKAAVYLGWLNEVKE